MIETIDTIQNMGRFEAFAWSKGVLPFQKVNLVLGYNGSGKTTLSNAFRLFSDNQPDGGASLFESLSGGRSDVTVSLRIDGKKNSFRPNGPKHPIYVFNSDFTAEHVYQGADFKFKAFEATVVTKDQLRNPRLAEIESKLAALQEKGESKTNSRRFEAPCRRS